MIHLAMPWADCFGAGTCGKYLIEEFAKRGPTWFSHPDGDDVSIATETPKGAVYADLTADLDMPLLQFPGIDLAQQTKFRGRPNVAYLFSEWAPLTARQVENLRAFDVLVAGSEWNAAVVRDAGLECAAVPQGVDCEVFRPMPVSHEPYFVIYSGGKWEHRKAQDLVIKAVKVMQERHDDVRLVASWVNLWGGQDGYDAARRAGLKLLGLQMLGHGELAIAMNATDVGLFPNRCEGGTNLVLMDYLACGKPVVATVTSGQKDVLDPAYSLSIKSTNDADVLEESIEKLESFYQHRVSMRSMGRRAADAMKAWPWSRTAAGIAKAIEAVYANRGPHGVRKVASGEIAPAVRMQ